MQRTLIIPFRKAQQLRNILIQMFYLTELLTWSLHVFELQHLQPDAVCSERSDSSSRWWWNSSDAASRVRNPWSPNPFIITQRNVKRTVGFLLVAAAIEPYPLKPNKNLLILIPSPPHPPIPAALQHGLRSDNLILTQAHDLPRSALILPPWQMPASVWARVQLSFAVQSLLALGP